MQIESMLVLFSVWKEKEVKSNCLISVRFYFGALECFGTERGGGSSTKCYWIAHFKVVNFILHEFHTNE